MPVEFAQIPVVEAFLGNKTDLQYHALMDRVLTSGVKKGDRTGTGTLSVFGHDMEFDLKGGTLPLITTKYIHPKSVIHELIWILKGSTNVKYLQENKVRIWNEWADEAGELGPVYGKQWRRWLTADGREVDQVGQVVNDLKSNPDSRRHVVSAWNVGEIDQMALPPCHLLFQFYVVDGRLSCQMYQRSADVFLGVPFNIASYAILTHMMAQAVGLEPDKFRLVLGDAHLYLNHLDQARLQLTRAPFPSPRIELNTTVGSIDDFKFDDIRVVDYQYHPHISAPISV